MTVPDHNRFDELPEDVMIHDNLACNRFEQRWQAGEQPDVEMMLGEMNTAHRDVLVHELLPLEIEYRRRAGLDLSIQRYRTRFPDADTTWLAALLADEREDMVSDAEGRKRGMLHDGLEQRPEAEAPEAPKALAGDSNALRGVGCGHTQFRAGMRLAERYRVMALLGRGGMGEVYHAYDLQLDQTVALKFLPERFASDPVARERLITEIRIARQVTHANVCRIHDMGEADGHIFLTMEYIDGEDLSQFIKRQGCASQEKATEISRQIGLGSRRRMTRA